MTKIIDLPTTASTDANTFVPVYKNGKTQKVSATALGGGGSGLDLTSTTDVPTVEGTEYIPLNKPLGTVLRVTVQRILDWILARANTWTGVQTFNTSINFTGAGRKITADFSNADVASRTVLQTNVTNAQTLVRTIPNGSATVAGIQAGNTSDPANQSAVTLVADGIRTAVVSGATGTGTQLPLEFEVNGAVRQRITTSGNILSTSGAIGYGAGTGGTVTQATSKSTAVTLNKICGQITMHNAALAANTTVRFIVNNTFVDLADEVSVWLTNPVNPSAYDVAVDGLGAGVFAIRLRNNTSTSYSDSVVLGFAVRKGATS